MAFDSATLTRARESGYSDEEVGRFVTQQDPRVKTALDSGYSLDEVAAFFDPKEAPEVKQTFGDKSSRFLAAASSQGIQAATAATRIGQFLQPQFSAIFDEVAKSTGLATIGEFQTELEGAAERSRDEYGVDPRQDNTFLSSLAEGAGSLLPTLASGPFAPYVNALSMGEQGFQDASQKGGTPEQQATSFIGNAATGFATEKLLGLPALLKSAQKAKLPEKAFDSLVRSVVKQAGLSFAREGTQETLEQISQDIIAKSIAAYDKDRNVFDLGKLGKTFLVGGLLGAPVGGLVQAAVSAETPAKPEMQDDAARIDDTLAMTASAEPPPLPGAELQTPPAQTEQGTPILSRAEIESVPLGTEEDLAAAATITPQTNAQAIPVDETQVPEGRNAPQPSGIESSPNLQRETSEESGRAELPQTPKVEFVGTAIRTPEGVATGESQGTAHPEIMGKAIDEGTPIEEMESALGFAFKKPDGTIEWVDRVEAGRRLTESGQLKGLKPGTKLTSEHIRGEVEGVTFTATPQPPPIDANQAATTLQPFFDKAVAAARAAGATDPEAAASQAQLELSQQIAEGTTTLDNPQALFTQAATQKGRAQLEKATAQKRGGGIAAEPIETVQPSTTEGPRAALLSEEDAQQISNQIGSLPQNQQAVMRALVDNPDITDQQLAEQTGLSLDQAKKAKGAARNALKQFIIDQGLGRSLGPGAASVDEILQEYELRKFGKRFQDTEEIAPEIKEATGDRYYAVIPNRVTAKRAAELIEENGDEDIEQQIRDESSRLSFADRNTVGMILMKRLNDRYKSLKDSNPEEAEKVLDRASKLAEWAQDFGTRLGQGVQSFAMWSRLTPEGKLRTFRKMVEKKTSEFIKDNRTDIDQIKDIVNGEGTSEQKVNRLRKLKNRTAKKVKSRVGRLIQMGKDGKLTDQKFFDATADLLGLPVFSPEVSREIQRLATLIDEAPDGMPKMEATLALNKYIAQQRGFDPSDLLFGIYYGNILSGGWTQAINLLDTSLNVVNEITTLAIQNPKAAMEIAAAAAKGFSSGRFDALTALMTGRRISDGKFVEDPFLMETAEFGKEGGVPIKNKLVKKLAESKGAKYLNLYKFIGRAMSASDALAFRTAQEAKAAQLAWIMANERGDTVERILGYDRLEDYRKQAVSEGYKGAQAEARASELMIMSRPEEIQRASTDFASEATYNVKPYGRMGSISNHIEAFTRDYKIGKLVVPFTRIVGNVVNRGLNNSPWGYVRAMRGKAGKGQSERVFTPEERNAMMVRATVSTALVSLLVALHEAGALTIHGAGPSDPEKKKQLRNTGWKPYTIQVGDNYFGYTYTPFGLFLSVTGNWLDNEKYMDFSSKTGLDKLSYAMSSLGSTIFNQSFLSGLSTMFDMLSGKSPAMQQSAMRRFTANTVSGVAVPFTSALKDIEWLFSDPNIPKVENMKQALIANIPFASQSLKPQLNALGEPIKTDRNRLFSSGGDDPVWRLVAQRGLRVPVPNNFFDDPEDQYQYVREQGQMLRKWMEANLNRLNDLPQPVAQDMIENASDAFRQQSRNRLIRQGAKKKDR